MEKHSQIVENFFTKCLQIIADARISRKEDQTPNSINRWFNLELEDTNQFLTELSAYKSINPHEKIPPLIVECCLDSSKLKPGQTLAFLHKRCASNQDIILERFTIECIPLTDVQLNELLETPTHTIYKQTVITMRALYSMLRLLPTHHLFERLRKQKLVQVNLKLKLCFPKLEPAKKRIGLHASLFHGHQVSVNKVELSSIPTKLGALACKVQYRQDVSFTEEDIEVLMAQKFMELDNTSSPNSSAGTSIPKPVLNFTKPFKSSVSTAGSVQSNSLSLQTASPVSSTSSKFSSSFARRPSVKSEAGLTDVNEFISFLNSVQTPSLKSSESVDEQLQRFQTMRVQLSDSLTLKERRSSQLEDEMLFALGD